MKQILQNLKTGQTELEEVPCPAGRVGHLLIRTRASLISAGTERMLMDFGKAGWIEKARQQPDKVRQVLDKIRTDGLIPTVEAVRAKLDQPVALGYCNVGIVLKSEVRDQRSEARSQSSEIGGGRRELRERDRVASNGPHAEVVCVPGNLCVRVPDEVSDEEAAFTVVGAIGLQGIRLAQPTLGECFVVMGLGLIGLMTVQILKAHGCRVLGVDLDPGKCALTRRFGAETVDISQGEDPVAAALAFSRGRGADGVLLTLAAKGNEPVRQAAKMCRKRGRIVLVGVTGLELNRADFYEKELSFQVSCSYGPGRYDPEYEGKGHDYPLGYVRWTEQRNFEAVLDLMASGRLDVRPLITHRYLLEAAGKAYELISKGEESYVGIILEYEGGRGLAVREQRTEIRGQKSEIGGRRAEDLGRTVRLKQGSAGQGIDRAVVGYIGAGNFSGAVLLPALKRAGVRLKTIASGGGVSGTHLGKKFGFEKSTTDSDAIFLDPEIQTVIIATRHDSHASLVLKALQAGKHVFVEKPLCLTLEELTKIQSVYASLSLLPSPLLLMVGFNRRFSSQIQKIRQLLEEVRSLKSFIMTVNAGAIPAGHWTQDPDVGGGRIIGEACHFIDLLRFLSGIGIAGAGRETLAGESADTTTIHLTFRDGSIGTIHYFANGNKSFPKERLEVFCQGKILQLDNFKSLRGYGWKSFSKMNLWRQDKGHAAGVQAFMEAVKDGRPSPIPFEEIVEVTRISIELR